MSPVHRPRASIRPVALAVAVACGTSAAPGASAQQAATSTLEEVVVTARMREEDLQETPISITAVTGRALEDRQLVTTEGLDQVAPNLVVSQGQGVSGNASAGSYFIRGIGQIDFLLNTDPGVGLYVDGVYVARSLGSIMDLIDLERVEVLRGPQGTLFGRNTIGGAISLVSEPPPREFGGEARLTWGEFDRDARASLGGPISEAVSGKLAVLWRDREGWVDRITDGSTLGDDESLAARGALRFEPGEGVTIDVAADFLDSEGTSTPSNVVQVVETANFPGFHNGAIAGPPCVPPPGSQANPSCFNPQWEASDRFREQGTFASNTTLDVWGVSLNASFELAPSLTLRAISGYRETEALGNRDGDHTPILIQNTTDTWEHEQWSQELQLLGTAFDGRFDWILGAYYFTEEGENLNFVTFPVVAIRSGGSVDNENTAVFGQATVDLTERLALTAGLRWTDETKTFLPDQIVLADPTGAFPPGSVPGFRLVPFVESRTTISETTPMANLAFAWTDDLMTYVSYSEGFKSGGFTQRIFPPLPAPPSFDPEFAKAYEAGFKWRLADGRMRLNGAAFTTDYTDLQVQVLVGVQPLTANAGEADVQGFELELEAAPTADFDLNLGIGYTDAEYTALDPTVLATGVTLDSKFAQVPEWTANLGMGYDIRPGFGGVVTLRVDLAYRSAAYMNSANTPSMRQGDYTLVNASIAWESGDGRWRATLFGHNLTDEEYFAGGFADLVDQGYAEVLLGRPREWGVTLGYRY